ncbi:MAG: transposase [Chloroflexota bacterium]
MALKVFKYRLYPTPVQEKLLLNALNCARNMYNMALAERKYAYQLEGRSVGKYEQLRQVKCYKDTFPQARGVHSHILQVAITDCDKAFQAFFRRVKAGEKPGYPRFRSWQRFSSIAFKEYGNGFRIDGRRLKVSGVGRIAVRWHRPLEGDVKTVRVIHKAGYWYACFACEVEAPTPLPATGQNIGIDVGISALITTSDGDTVENPNYYRVAQRKLRILQRRLARAQRGSNNRKKALLSVQRQQEHVANQRKDYLNKLAHTLVQNYDGIALEDLRITNMVRNHHLSKSILDSGWGYFRGRLTHKAESAGRVVVFVDPAYTSKCCSNCGAMFQDFSLSTRWVECECGLSLDRDHNAALNILNRAGLDKSVKQNVAPLLPLNTSEGKRKRASEATRL